MSDRRVLIVDGYNVIRNGEPYATLAREDMDAARARLASDIAQSAYAADAVLLVFDGGGNPQSDGVTRPIAGIHVVFSRFGSDADSVIEREAMSRRTAGERVTVVSSDAQTQWATVGGGVARMSAAEFVRALATDRAEHSESRRPRRPRSMVSERVDADVAATLSRWARGGL
ncbi:MAG TPA: NYN domain-containing protein [Coriobacteriia bacterium]|nr:NYN domain-containing protein [Coriobacteriia bacterium]